MYNNSHQTQTPTKNKHNETHIIKQGTTKNKTIKHNKQEQQNKHQNENSKQYYKADTNTKTANNIIKQTPTQKQQNIKLS